MTLVMRKMAFMNERIQIFADYWMKLYSNCCLPQDYAVESLDGEKPDEAKAFLRDWPSTTGAPKIPQLLFEIPAEPKRKKRSAALIKCDAVSIIEEMKDNYIRGNKVLINVPNVFPEGEVSLTYYEDLIK